MEAKPEECNIEQCCKNEQPVKGKIQQDRAKAKAERALKLGQKMPTDRCFKCDSKPKFTYRNSVLCCNPCFKLHVMEAKFRSCLRRDLDIRGSTMQKILILLSGGPSSTSLTYMVGESVKGKTASKRKMFFEAEVLHVDESCFYPEDEETNIKNLQKIEFLCNEIAVKLHIIRIDETLGLTREKCREIITHSNEKGSCREDLVKLLRNRAILEFCNNNEFKKLVSGDNGLRVFFS